MKKKSNISYEDLVDESHDPRHPCSELWKQYELRGIERGENICELMNKLVPLEKKLVLDLGSGDGGVSIAFSKQNSSVTSIEPDLGRLKRTKLRAMENHVNLDLLRGRSEDLPFADKTFDVVIMNDVIEHVEDRIQTITEASRVLKTGGLIYLTAPNKLSIRNLLKDPHYGLFGITVLPHALASFYVTKIRRRIRTYEVGDFPTLSFTKDKFAEADISMKLLNQLHIGEQFKKKTHPDLISSAVTRIVIKALNLFRLNYIINGILLLKLNILSSVFVLVGQKNDERIRKCSLQSLFYDNERY